MGAAAIVIAACALLFTVVSFWWLNARRGRLVSYTPHSFAAYVQPDRTLIRLPLVFYNDGAIPIVVQNLRLSFPSERYADSLPWARTRRTLQSTEHDVEDLPAVFSVPGRTALQKIVEFDAAWPGEVLVGRNFSAAVDAHLGHSNAWVAVVTFTLHLEAVEHPQGLVAYSNDLEQIADGAEERSKAAADELRRRIHGDSESI